MKQICTRLTDEQHPQLTNKLKEEGIRNFENETFSGFSITLKEVFPEVNISGALDLDNVKWNIV